MDCVLSFVARTQTWGLWGMHVNLLPDQIKCHEELYSLPMQIMGITCQSWCMAVLVHDFSLMTSFVLSNGRQTPSTTLVRNSHAISNFLHMRTRKEVYYVQVYRCCRAPFSTTYTTKPGIGTNYATIILGVPEFKRSSKLSTNMTSHNNWVVVHTWGILLHL
jgi:hypothetical protein